MGLLDYSFRKKLKLNNKNLKSTKSLIHINDKNK